MNQLVNDKLKKEYLEKYPNKSKRTASNCIKYFYPNKDKGFFVNIYYDLFDINNPSFILVLIEDKDSVDDRSPKYYLTNLNIFNTNISEYLPNIPSEILDRILTNGSLEEFYQTLEKKILSGKPLKNITSYDKVFKTTAKKWKPSIYSDSTPFLYAKFYFKSSIGTVWYKQKYSHKN